MTQRRCGVGAVVLAACIVAHGAHAQPRARHDKLNIAIAVGQGFMSTSCETCNRVPDERASLMTVRAGWTLHDLAIVAAEATLLSRSMASGRDDQPIETSFQAFTASVFAYAGQRSEVFIKLGAGIARGKRNVQLSTDTLRSDVEVTTPVFRFGIGVDMRLGRTWSLTPVIEYLAALPRTSREIWFLPLDARTASGVRAKNNLLVIALGLTFP